jgi:hypothetical protein
MAHPRRRESDQHFDARPHVSRGTASDTERLSVSSDFGSVICTTGASASVMPGYVGHSTGAVWSCYFALARVYCLTGEHKLG